MALALLLRGGRGAPLSTELGRWVRYRWMALRLSALRICRPQKSQCSDNAPEGRKRHPLICRMNLKNRPMKPRFALRLRWAMHELAVRHRPGPAPRVQRGHHPFVDDVDVVFRHPTGRVSFQWGRRRLAHGLREVGIKHVHGG